MPDENDDALQAWENEQREISQAQIDTPSPNDIIEQRAELRDSGMDPDQIDRAISRETLQHDEPERSEWYRQTQAEHDLDLAAPQRFPLTGDGLVAQRIVADGPFNGPDVGAELALARYRDWEFQQRRAQMPDVEADRMADTYWDNLISRARQTEQNAQAYAASQRQTTQERPETEIVERPGLTLR
jgi:hypothetical protein